MHTAIVQQHNQLTTNHTRQVDLRWLDFWNLPRALVATQDEIMQLDGARTDERHTWRAYGHALLRFLLWGRARAAGLDPVQPSMSTDQIDDFFQRLRTEQPPIVHPLPSPDLMRAFIAHLLDDGLKPNTINQKYLAPIRKYLRALVAQEFDVTRFDSLPAYIQAQEWRESIRTALTVKAKAVKTTHQSPLFSVGTRLTPQQVNGLLWTIDRATLRGLRDYALILTAISSGLRIAELRRITLDSIRPEGDGYLIRVRGKRGNMDPVPVSDRVYKAIMAYVYEYNRRSDQPITQDSPIWCGILTNDELPDAASNPIAGPIQSANSLARIIISRVKGTLGIPFSAHDTRRTCAYLAYKNGMSLSNIRQLLRHADISTTARYIGVEPDYAGFTLATYVAIG
jgi:integrase